MRSCQDGATWRLVAPSITQFGHRDYESRSIQTGNSFGDQAEERSAPVHTGRGSLCGSPDQRVFSRDAEVEINHTDTHDTALAHASLLSVEPLGACTEHSGTYATHAGSGLPNAVFGTLQYFADSYETWVNLKDADMEHTALAHASTYHVGAMSANSVHLCTNNTHKEPSSNAVSSLVALHYLASQSVPQKSRPRRWRMGFGITPISKQ